MNFIGLQNDTREDYRNVDDDDKKKTTWRHRLCHQRVFAWAFLVLFAFSPIWVYYAVVDEGAFARRDVHTCLVNGTFRVSCGATGAAEGECLGADCCYDTKTRQCYHSVPSRYYYEPNGDAFAPSHEKTPIGTPASRKLKITVDEIDADTVKIVLHEADVTVPNNTLAQKNYSVKMQKEKLEVEVFRNGSGSRERLLSTAYGPLMVSEHYFEWTLYLTNHSLFGLNRTLITVRENSNSSNLTTFTKTIYANADDHHSAPVLWAYAAGKFHGVRVDFDGPLEIRVLPSNLVVLRSPRSGPVELVLSTGPTPRDLHDQQATLGGAPPPFWLLGTHVCRNSDNRNITELIQQFTMDAYADSYCIDDNIYMALVEDNSTHTNIFGDTLKALSEQGKRFLLSVPPQLPANNGSLFSKAASSDLLYRNKSDIYRGKYRNATVVYPDFGHERIHEYLDEFSRYIGRYVHVDIDGFVLKDNWPVDDSFDMEDNSTFPYFTEEMKQVFSKTIPWNATIDDIPHIRKHNSYGRSQTLAFENYYNEGGQKTAILSSAKIFGRMQSVSAIQNVDASWDNLRHFIDNILFSSITGNHLVSVPVCGDTAAFDTELQQRLCLRWYLVASTMPFLRVSSPSPWREPSSRFDYKVAIDRRLTLLRHYYTILARNEPLVRPMFYDHHQDESTFSLTNQYMLGASVLVAHPLTENRNKLRVYLPPGAGVWYEMWGGRGYATNATSCWTDVDVVETDLVAFVAQGTIIPFTVGYDINLMVALNCTAESCRSTGTLLLDTLVSFTADNASVTIFDAPISNCNYTLGHIQLYDHMTEPFRNQYYPKNESLCGRGSNFTVFYEDNESSTTTQTSTTVL